MADASTVAPEDASQAYIDPVRELNKLWKYLEREHERRCKDPFSCYDPRGCNAVIMEAFNAEVERFQKEHPNP